MPGDLARTLRHWASLQPDKTLYTFVDDAGKPERSLTYADALGLVNRIGDVVTSTWGVAPGSRVLLVYPPGLDFIVAFLACLDCGVIPVPVYPPSPASLDTDLPKLNHVAADSGACAILTCAKYYRLVRLSKAWDACRCRSRWPKQPWHCTDSLRAATGDGGGGGGDGASAQQQRVASKAAAAPGRGGETKGKALDDEWGKVAASPNSPTLHDAFSTLVSSPATTMLCPKRVMPVP